MYAIVDIAGQQFKVEKDQQIFVHRLEGNEGDKVSFNQVLLIDNDGKIAVGAPAVNDAAVTGKIIEHLRGDKVIVFKKKRRKGYQKRNGHRQDFTKIQIESILETGGSKVAAKAPAAKVKEVVAEAEVKKPAAKAASSTAKTETKTTSAKTEKKPAAKKTAAAKPKAEGVKKAPAKKATPKKKADDK
jgi:large subunit ribosomal protein L21